ncbi:MAG: acyltransferase [Pseudomonadota bacterium]
MNPQHNLKIVTFPRFIAGLGAVCWHFILNTNFIEKVEPFQSWWLARAFTHCAPIGMAYFYALSGFVLAAVYYRPGMAPLNFRQFFLMRMARIYPIFFLALVMYLALTWDRSIEDPLGIGLNLLLLQSWVSPYPLSLNYPAWTLSVEVFFYLVFPFFLLSFDRYSTRQLFVFTGVVWLISNLLQLYYTVRLHPAENTLAQDLLIFLPPINFNGFLVGMLGGICIVRHGQPPSRFAGVNIAIVVLCTAAPIAMTLAFGRHVNVGATAPFLTLLMYTLVTQRSWLWDWMSNRHMETLGQVSYAMCIFQVPLFLLFLKFATHRVRLSPTELFYLYFAALMALSYLVYFFYEAPLRDWARDKIKRPSKTQATVPA